jgi:chromosome segregation ATPase
MEDIIGSSEKKLKRHLAALERQERYWKGRVESLEDKLHFIRAEIVEITAELDRRTDARVEDNGA